MANIDEKTEDPLEGLIEEQNQKLHIPGKLPVLLLRDVVIFPYMIAPLFVGREKSKAAIDQSLAGNRMVLLLTQKDMERRGAQARRGLRDGHGGPGHADAEAPRRPGPHPGPGTHPGPGRELRRGRALRHGRASPSSTSPRTPRRPSRARPSSATSAPAWRRPPRSARAFRPRSSSSPPTSTSRAGWPT